jgi:ParB family chromosome partitioning protein
LSVREAEALARKVSTGSTAPRSRGATSARSEKDADTLALERNIAEQLGLKVEINHTGDEGGEVTVTYKSLEQLDEICRRLAGRGAARIN